MVRLCEVTGVKVEKVVYVSRKLGDEGTAPHELKIFNQEMELANDLIAR